MMNSMGFCERVRMAARAWVLIWGRPESTRTTASSPTWTAMLAPAPTSIWTRPWMLSNWMADFSGTASCSARAGAMAIAIAAAASDVNKSVRTDRDLCCGVAALRRGVETLEGAGRNGRAEAVPGRKPTRPDHHVRAVLQRDRLVKPGMVISFPRVWRAQVEERAAWRVSSRIRATWFRRRLG